jgi:hypothetical protein
MFRSILSMSLSLMAGVVLLALPASSEPQYSRAPGDIVVAHNDYNNYDDHREDWNARTCCRREERGGYTIFWSTVGECRRSRGEATTNKECRKHGGYHRYEGSNWNDHRDDDRGQGDGWRGNGGQGNDWNARVCCTRNNQAWWSTRGECRRSSGYEAPNRACRN